MVERFGRNFAVCRNASRGSIPRQHKTDKDGIVWEYPVTQGNASAGLAAAGVAHISEVGVL